jgi:asparagine synthase (glutamine-hydrolysing)
LGQRSKYSFKFLNNKNSDKKMCGISGIINKNNADVKLWEIKAITDVIAHRGPDGEGFLLENNFALGHRRLAIIDTSADGDQPMWYENKYAIVFNGEIYNYLEIREQLVSLGYLFTTGTDTEVILAAYDYWGVNCVSYFNGMWAFALYDKKQNTIFCSRDRFGIKPLYFAYINNCLYFSSFAKLSSILCR